MPAAADHWMYFAAALILSAVLVPLMRPLSFRVGAVDRGTGRRVHNGVIPRLGGIGIFFAFLIPAAFSLYQGAWDGFHTIMLGIFLGSCIIVLTGLYDDMKGAKVSHKLLAEVFSALLIYAWGIRIDVITNPLGSAIVLGWLSLPVTVLWIVVIVNAINLMDGLDGLAAGSSIFIAIIFLFISAGDPHEQLVLLVLIGALAGFLIYNMPPASIFMGDSGSLFVGFILATMSIMSSRKATALTAVMVPIIAFSVPLMDMAYAVFRRYYRGLSLGQPDSEHIHHKLLEKGLSRRKVLMVMYSVNILVLLIALLAIRQKMNVTFGAVASMALVAIAGMRLLGYVQFIPFIREMKRNFDLNRKRKYCSYLIRRFRAAAGSAASTEELKRHLREMMELYNLDSARIYFYARGAETPFFVYTKEGSEEGDSRHLAVRVPLVINGRKQGRIDITRQMDGDYLLCTAELLNALAEAMGRIASLESPAGSERTVPGMATSGNQVCP